MSKLKAFLFSMGLVLAAPAAFATSSLWSGVTVSSIDSYTSEGFASSGMVVVHFSASSSSGAACASSNRAYGVVDVTTAGGAFTAAVLQSARLSGTTVTVNGTGACTTYSSIENIGDATE